MNITLRARTLVNPLAAVFAATMFFAAPNPAAAHEVKAGDLTIIHPWSKPAPKGAKVAGGYVIVKNNGATADKLIGASGEIAGKTEIHDMNVDAAGVMTMRQLKEGVEVPAGGEVELKPGAMHIMFMDLNSTPAPGRKFKGSLTFEKAGKVDVVFYVLKPEESKKDDEHKNHGG